MLIFGIHLILGGYFSGIPSKYSSILSIGSCAILVENSNVDQNSIETLVSPLAADVTRLGTDVTQKVSVVGVFSTYLKPKQTDNSCKKIEIFDDAKAPEIGFLDFIDWVEKIKSSQQQDEAIIAKSTQENNCLPLSSDMIQSYCQFFGFDYPFTGSEVFSLGKILDNQLQEKGYWKKIYDRNHQHREDYRALGTTLIHLALEENSSFNEIKYKNSYLEKYYNIATCDPQKTIPVNLINRKVRLLNTPPLENTFDIHNLEKIFLSMVKKGNDLPVLAIDTAQINKKLIILGSIGIGKSTFLKRLGFELLFGRFSQESLIPIYLDLKSLKDDLNPIGEIADIMSKMSNSIVTEKLVLNFLEHGKLFLLLDAIDEISSPHHILQWCTLISQSSKNRFAIVSRTLDSFVEFEGFSDSLSLM